MHLLIFGNYSLFSTEVYPVDAMSVFSLWSVLAFMGIFFHERSEVN